MVYQGRQVALFRRAEGALAVIAPLAFGMYGAAPNVREVLRADVRVILLPGGSDVVQIVRPDAWLQLVAVGVPIPGAKGSVNGSLDAGGRILPAGIVQTVVSPIRVNHRTGTIGSLSRLEKVNETLLCLRTRRRGVAFLHLVGERVLDAESISEGEMEIASWTVIDFCGACCAVMTEGPPT
jgi:hypothetical protein